MPRGGKRPGAGRKQSPVTKLKAALISDLAAGVFKQIKKIDEWVKVITDGDPRVKLEALRYLEDREHGRPKQEDAEPANQTTVFNIHWNGPKPPWAP